MTEEGWLACSDPKLILEYLRSKGSPRKFRLFAVACCRRIEHLMKEETSQTGIGVVERYADGLATAQDLAVFHVEDNTIFTRYWSTAPDEGAYYAAAIPYSVGCAAAHHDAAEAATAMPEAIDAAYFGVGARFTVGAMKDFYFKEETIQSALLRDIFGNPFRPVTVNPAWQTANVVTMAQAIYDDRDFERMPVLGDALEDAGCTNADVLNHCRQPGEHVRGCWVVDLLLGKA